MFRTLLMAGVALTLAGAASARELKAVGVTVGSLGNPFFVAVGKGATDAVRQINPQARVTVSSADYDLNKQFTQIDNFIASGVYMVLLNAADPTAIEPAMVRLKAAGITSAALDVTARGADAQVQTDNLAAGRNACRYITDKLGGNGNVVIITGHIDSRVTDVMNFTSDAPGANDDGSGTAAVIEAARVLSKHKFPGTIVYAAVSGEEQGLLGAKILADYAKAQGWNVITDLNNDIIGNSCSTDGVCDDTHVRVLSEGPRSQGQAELAAATHSLGGENDAPSRNISRYLDGLADRLNIGLDVMQIWRNDRFGRGGDHTEFLNSGYPAVRLSVAVENYNCQHQDLRTEKGIKYGDTIENMDLCPISFEISARS